MRQGYLGRVIAIIGDTHMPKGERRLPERCLELLRDAELIAHTGDFSAATVLAELEAIGPPVVAVHGNVDDPQLKRRLPEAIEFEVAAGIVVGMVHDSGPAKGRLERMRRRFPACDAVLFGHSHLPLHERAPDGFQNFNPGSPTERRRAPRHSMGVGRVERDRLVFEPAWL